MSRELKTSTPDAEPLLGGADAPPKDGQSVAAAAPAGDQEESVLQFEAPIFFAAEDEGSVRITVTRLGGVDRVSSVKFFTEEGSAKAGVSFVETACEVSFDVGEDAKDVIVDLVQGDDWQATLEFKVRLSDPVNGVLGAYLHTSRVKVIDGGYFPSEKFRGLAMDDVNSFLLLCEFFRWNFWASGLAIRTCTVLLMDQLKNAYTYAQILANAFLVNYVCSTDESFDEGEISERLEKAYMVSAVIIVPFFVLHLWDSLKAKFDIAGRSTAFLRATAFRKYMNLSEESKQTIKPELFERYVSFEAKAAAQGYAAGVALFEVMGGIGVNIYFILLSSPRAQIYAVGIPVFVLAWGWLRHIFMEPPDTTEEEVGMTRCMREVVMKFETISSYYLRPMVNADFAGRSENLRSKEVHSAMYNLRTDFIVRCLGPVCTGLYIIFGVPAVLRGAQSLGAFLATMGAIQSICDQSAGGFELCRSLAATTGPVAALTAMFNSRTDLLTWKAVNRRRRATSAVLAREGGLTRDMMPIRLAGVGFTIPEGPELFRAIDLEVPQGKLVAVFGAHSSGKSHLLRLLAHHIFPSEGEIFIASHLRILHVARDAQLLDRSLLDNLTLGLPGPPGPKDIKRLLEILNELGLHELQPQVEEEFAREAPVDGPQTWMKALTPTEVSLIGLTRALVMNPEVMVLQKPFLMFQSEMCKKLGGVLAEHVENRGLKLDPATVSLRRPRTVIMSVAAGGDAEFASAFWTTLPAGEGCFTAALAPPTKEA